MSFWRRIKQSQIHAKLWNQFTTARSYHQIRSPVTFTAEPTRIWLLNSPRLPARKPQLEVPTNVRFFAKKKAKPKPKPKVVEEEDHRPRLNEEITGDKIRLVTDEGHSIMSKHEALKLAKSLELDLVEVQRNVTPPVCKIKDYRQEKYKLHTKEKERSKEKSAVTIRQGACKEIRFSAKITQKDLEVKADAAKRLMEHGYRVKCVAVGNTPGNTTGNTPGNTTGSTPGNTTGNTPGNTSSKKLLSRFTALMEDTAVVESQTTVADKDQIHIIMRHVKYGPLKKGPGKKANIDKQSTKEAEKTDAGASDDFGQLFDIPENVGNVSSSSNNETLSSARGTSRSPSAGGSTNYASNDERETSRPMPGFSNVARQPQQGFGEFSISKSPNFSQRGFPPNTPGSPTSAPNFGIFSNQEKAAEKNGGPVEVNRYKQRTGSGSDSQRNSSPPRPPMGHGNKGISSTRDGRPSHR